MPNRRWENGRAVGAVGLLMLLGVSGQAQQRAGQTLPVQPLAPRPVQPVVTGQPRTGQTAGQSSTLPNYLRPDKDGVIRMPTLTLSAPAATVNGLPPLGAAALTPCRTLQALAPLARAFGSANSAPS